MSLDTTSKPVTSTGCFSEAARLLQIRRHQPHLLYQHQNHQHSLLLLPHLRLHESSMMTLARSTMFVEAPSCINAVLPNFSILASAKQEGVIITLSDCSTMYIHSTRCASVAIGTAQRPTAIDHRSWNASPAGARSAKPVGILPRRPT